MNFAVYAHARAHAWNFAPASYHLCLTSFSKNSASYVSLTETQICLMLRTSTVLKEPLDGATPRTNPQPERSPQPREHCLTNDNIQPIAGSSIVSPQYTNHWCRLRPVATCSDIKPFGRNLLERNPHRLLPQTPITLVSHIHRCLSILTSRYHFNCGDLCNGRSSVIGSIP